MRIPFDSLCVAAIAWEIRAIAGARLQRVIQSDPWTLHLTLYGRGEHGLLVSWRPELARIHLASRRPVDKVAPGPFCLEIRQRLEGAFLVGAEQVGFDRVLRIAFAAGDERWELVCEPIGAHANAMLVAPDGRMVGAARWVGAGKSKRPLLPGRPYEPPPLSGKPDLFAASSAEAEGVSPFLRRWLEATGFAAGRDQVRGLIEDGVFSPCFAPGSGAYPLSVAPLGLAEVARASLSLGVEQHFASLARAIDEGRVRTGLLAQLRRVLLAREVALDELAQAADAAIRADRLQRMGELILAYQGQVKPGSRVLEAYDYEGNPVAIDLRPDLSPLENAQRCFERAKRAKAGAGLVAEQIARLAPEREALATFIERIEQTDDLDELDRIRDEAEKRRWLHAPAAPRHKEDRPYEGKAVRETTGPGGWRILYGENAEANDYLTLRVAKPHDWWMHVRGAAGSHVVIVTEKKPERVPRETLMFAARLAVAHSAAKHSSFVPVDYCLRKYVRRSKGAAPGTAFYSHEKTLHVEKS